MDLVLVNDNDLQRRVTIEGTLSVGRESHCDFVVVEARVSRKHFTLTYEDDQTAFLKDTSSNGTWVNGVLVDESFVEEGDIVEIGRSTRFNLEKSQPSLQSDTSFETLDLENFSRGIHLPLKDLEDRMEATMIYLQALQLAREPEGLYRAASHFLGESFPVDRLVLVVGQGAGFRRFENTTTPLGKKWAQKPLSTTVIERACQQKQAVLARLIHGELAGSVSAELSEIKNVIVVPLMDAQGEVLGALYADNFSHSASLTLDDLKILAQGALPLGRSLEACLLHARLVQNHPQENLIGSSAVMEALKDKINRIASVDSPVLIQGPSGSGKQLAARLIHQNSARSLGPFVVLDGASLTESLAASEFFGHVKGAFTGADSDREGVFFRANGGTLLLSHVDELSMDVQALLLRVLESKTVRPIGSTEEIPFSTRLLGTTNKDLKDLVEQEKFRRDLFYRIQVISLPVPGLENRLEDIEALAAYFIDVFCRQQGRALPRWEPGFREALMKRPWPGHVRQLRNVIERILVLGSHATLHSKDLEAAESGDDNFSLDHIIYKHIIRVLELCQGNKSQAAELLGIDRSTLYSRLRQMGAK